MTTMRHAHWGIPLSFAFVGATHGWLSTWIIELVSTGRWGCSIPGPLWQRAVLAVVCALAMVFAALITRREMAGPAWARATAARVAACCGGAGALLGFAGGGVYLLPGAASGVAVGIACVPWALLIVAGRRTIAMARRGSLLEGAERAAFALAFLCGVLLVPWWASRHFATAGAIVLSTALAAVAIGLQLRVLSRRLHWVAELFSATPSIDAHVAARAPLRIDLGVGDGARSLQRGGHPYRGGGHVRAACRGELAAASSAAKLLMRWTVAALCLAAAQWALILLHRWSSARELWWC